VTSGVEPTPELAAELARLQAAERELRAERDRIRATAADEVARLQAALRESAGRASERERELNALSGQLQRRSSSRPRLRGFGRRDPDVSGALERVLATFEDERRRLEERARAVAATEARQGNAQAALQAQAERVAAATGELDERKVLSAELAAAGKRIAKLERQLAEHNETESALKAARAEIAALALVVRERREAEAALVATQARLAEVERSLEASTATAATAATVAHVAGDEHEVEERIEQLLARRERELEQRSAGELERRREELEQTAAADLDRRRAELESQARAELAQRERELSTSMASELVERREALELEAAQARSQLLAGRGAELSRERASLRGEVEARERELARREEEVTRREIELSIVRRRIGDEEVRLQERAWRTGGGGAAGGSAPVVARTGGEATFSEGWRLLTRGRDAREPDARDGSW
jgi:DNA repair exonuclease SbcCD ATPase subunit